VPDHFNAVAAGQRRPIPHRKRKGAVSVPWSPADRIDSLPSVRLGVAGMGLARNTFEARRSPWLGSSSLSSLLDPPGTGSRLALSSTNGSKVPMLAWWPAC
jgi:hypothetical protein